MQAAVAGLKFLAYGEFFLKHPLASTMQVCIYWLNKAKYKFEVAF